MPSRLAALISVLVVAAAACGGAGGDTATVEGSPTTTQTTPGLQGSASEGPGQGTTQPTTGSEFAGEAAPGPDDLDQLFPAGATVAVTEVARRPHDTTAFTQGLEFDGDQLYESRGLFASQEDITLTEIDPMDGTTIRSVERDTDIGDYFAEGLTIVGDRLIQLTWRSNTAIVYDTQTLEKTDEYVYQGEGWGICDQPDRLIMSSGTPTLTHRDPETFEVTQEVTVTLDGTPVDELNELECVGDLVLANVWNTNRIVVIEPDTGDVRTVIDGSAVADERGQFIEDPEGGSVLNGIAYNSQSDTWLITGKRWPFMFEVAFECTSGCGPTPSDPPGDPPSEPPAEKTHFVRQALPDES
ncbi:glutaminyl-peptide cyclotransferase [Euzebya tangerina]|uniref:glutaminyl-peptide cyclotransferase n=1 Tax=Euzebya tangerina TaxID=591198 RepID=UPI000E316DE8|nr:glutaminyl-peptide cyclotransferase [Euzebya tangerina]